jgi:hypothetical protein
MKYERMGQTGSLLKKNALERASAEADEVLIGSMPWFSEFLFYQTVII